MSEADPERLAAIHAAAFAGGEVWDRGALASVLGLAGAFAVERPGGMAIFRVVLDEAELLTIGVLPGNRRQGTGRALLAQGIADCIARGAGRLFLEVAADNQPALALYESVGFAPVGRRPKYYANGRDAVLMALSCR